METKTISTKIPLKIGSRLGLEITEDLARSMNWGSDKVKILPYGNSLLVVPQDIPDDELWYWTPEWQHKEREAEKDIKNADLSGPFDNADDLIAHLRSSK